MPAFPSSLGGCIDQAYKLREKRLAAQKAVDALKADEEAIKNHIINSFGKTEIDGAKGKMATASITKRTVAQVDSWEDFQKWFVAEAKKGRAPFEMLQRRINDSSYRERLENEEVVPGIQPYVVISLSLTKASK